MVLGMELERDGVSRRGVLKERRISTSRYIMTSWLTNDVRGIIEKTCGIVADIDTMGDRGGWGVPGGGGRE